MTKKMEDIDLKIIRALEEDSRVSLHKLANKIGSTISIVQRRIKNLELTGLIEGYSPLIDTTKLGYDVTAIIMLQIESGHLNEVENEIAKDGDVLSVYEITGDFDAVAFTKFKDNSSLNVFLKNLLAIRFIKKTVAMIASNIVKESCCII
jgi:Lrp/AsnC family transcriptional regulator, regulator for asnA, asnC and gidA